MPLPVFEKQDQIPKGFEELYEEKDGKWQAKASDTSKLEETLGKVRQEKKDADKAARIAEDRAADLQRKLDAKEASGAETDKKVSDMLAKWEEDKNKAVQAVEKERDDARTELRTLRLDDKLKAAFLAAGGRPERVEKAIADTKRHFDLVDGEIVHKDEKGTVTTTKVTDFYGKSYKTEMPEFYSGTKATGGGANGGEKSPPVSSDIAERVIKDPLAVLNETNLAGVGR